MEKIFKFSFKNFKLTDDNENSFGEFKLIPETLSKPLKHLSQSSKMSLWEFLYKIV